MQYIRYVIFFPDLFKFFFPSDLVLVKLVIMIHHITSPYKFSIQNFPQNKHNFGAILLNAVL